MLLRIASRGMLLVVLSAVVACHPTPGPDKAAIGGVLGAGWGAGAGAVIGNQVGAVGPGAAIGAGFGAVSGAITGAGLDISEGTELAMQRELDVLRVQVAANQRSLNRMQNNLDDRTRRLSATSSNTLVYFDEERAFLRLGSVEQLQRLASLIKSNPYISRIELHGHSEDTGDPDKNERLSEARARTIANFLGNQGVSLDQVQMFAHGATRPVASNESGAGRQFNRRVEIVFVR